MAQAVYDESGMITLSDFTEKEVKSLSDTSEIPLIVKDGVFHASSMQALLADIRTIIESNRLSAARMGSKGNVIIGSDILRGDLTCWVTPDLCKDLQLPAMKSYVQAMIKLLKPFHQELGLAADYSVQCALYVSQVSQLS